MSESTQPGIHFSLVISNSLSAANKETFLFFFPGAVEYEVYSKLEEEDELDFTRTTNRSVVMVRGLSSGSTYQFAIKTIAESKKTSEFSDLYTITTRQ